MNTVWADTSGVHDDLTAGADLVEWLIAVRDPAPLPTRAGDDELEQARNLRDALRRIAAHATHDERPAASSAIADLDAALDVLNHLADALPRRRLAIDDESLLVAEQVGPSPVAAELSRVAAAAVDLFGGEHGAQLRACHASGCVLYFLRSHPRREWCSVACGNRARAARHYQRTRAAR